MAASEPDEIIVADVKQGYNPPPVRRVERPKLPVPPPRRPSSDSGAHSQNSGSND